MKIKTLLLTAVVAGMSFSASAYEYVKNNGDYVYSDEGLEMNMNDTINLKCDRQRYTSTNMANIQIDFIFPEGIRPVANASGRYARCGDDAYLDGEALLTWATNFDYTDFYPQHRVVGANFTKTRITANPAHIATFFFAADDQMVTGDYQILGTEIKYTDYEDVTYWSYVTEDDGETPTFVFTTIHVNGVSGINDLTVENANKTYKTIENGQVYIIKDGVKYNTMGQLVK